MYYRKSTQEAAIMEEMKDEKLQDIQKTNSKKAETSYPLSVIPLNVNGLNSPTKRQIHRMDF